MLVISAISTIYLSNFLEPNISKYSKKCNVMVYPKAINMRFITVINSIMRLIYSNIRQDT